MKLGLLATLSTAYEGMPPDLVARKRAEADGAAAQLAALTGDELVVVGPIASDEEGEGAARALADSDVYAVVILPTIATMASVPWAALQATDVPLVIWSRTESEPHPASAQDVVYASGPIGATAIGNILAREGRRFRSTVGVAPSFRVLSFLHGARAARALGTAVFGHFGGAVWPGMLDVVVDRGRLAAALGARVVDLEPDWSAPPADLGQLDVGAVGEDVLRRSLALAGAIAATCRREGIAAGAIHCHGAAFALNPDVGVVCCAAASALATSGTPFACTGDDCTAVALFLAEQLGGAAQYLELDGPHDHLDACLVSSGGEGDLRLASADHPVRARENRFFGGVAGRGMAVDFVLRPGPVTLIAFTPIGEGFRIIAAEGDVLAAAPPPLGMPRGYVRFPRPAAEAFDWWCEAGANHHLALAPGTHGEAVRAFAEVTSIESMVLSR